MGFRKKKVDFVNFVDKFMFEYNCWNFLDMNECC